MNLEIQQKTYLQTTVPKEQTVTVRISLQNDLLNQKFVCIFFFYQNCFCKQYSIKPILYSILLLYSKLNDHPIKTNSLNNSPRQKLTLSF